MNNPEFNSGKGIKQSACSTLEEFKLFSVHSSRNKYDSTALQFLTCGPFSSSGCTRSYSRVTASQLMECILEQKWFVEC